MLKYFVCKIIRRSDAEERQIEALIQENEEMQIRKEEAEKQLLKTISYSKMEQKIIRMIEEGKDPNEVLR